MSAVTTHLVTIEEFEQLPLERVELVRGEIVEMPPPGTEHAVVCSNLNYVLAHWTRQMEGFLSLGNDGGIVTSHDPDSVRGPDGAIVRSERLAGGRVPQGSLRVAPELTAEVKSLSDSWPKTVGRVSEYLAAGVPEVWIVDPDKRHVHVYSQNDEPTILTADDTLTSNTLPGFTTPVADFFHGL